MVARRRRLGRLAAVLILAAVLVGCRSTQTGEAQSGPHPSPQPSPQPSPLAPETVQPAVQPQSQSTIQPTLRAAIQPFVLEPLTEAGLDLRAGPVDVPIELRLPSIKVSAAVIGVGLTAMNVMNAPKGPIDDPIWQKVFWYRGSGTPGDSGTAMFAGHVNDPLSRPAVFARLDDLHPGDDIVIHDTRGGLDLRYRVTQIKIYTIQQASDPAVLALIYGPGPVSGQGPQPAPDGLSHLTLVTCAGNIVNGEFDHAVVVYATRVQQR